MSKHARVKSDRDYLMSGIMRVADIEKKGKKKLRKANIKKSCKYNILYFRIPQGLMFLSEGFRKELQGVRRGHVLEYVLSPAHRRASKDSPYFCRRISHLQGLHGELDPTIPPPA